MMLFHYFFGYASHQIIGNITGITLVGILIRKLFILKIVLSNDLFEGVLFMLLAQEIETFCNKTSCCASDTTMVQIILIYSDIILLFLWICFTQFSVN